MESDKQDARAEVPNPFTRNFDVIFIGTLDQQASKAGDFCAGVEKLFDKAHADFAKAVIDGNADEAAGIALRCEKYDAALVAFSSDRRTERLARAVRDYKTEQSVNALKAKLGVALDDIAEKIVRGG